MFRIYIRQCKRFKMLAFWKIHRNVFFKQILNKMLACNYNASLFLQAKEVFKCYCWAFRWSKRLSRAAPTAWSEVHARSTVSTYFWTRILLLRSEFYFTAHENKTCGDLLTNFSIDSKCVPFLQFISSLASDILRKRNPDTRFQFFTYFFCTWKMNTGRKTVTDCNLQVSCKW